MSRFYFDVRDGENFVSDKEGLEFPTAKEARDDASRALGQMIKEAMPDGQHHDMAVEVRGADKRPLFKVQITFDVEPLAEHAFPAPL
jgi:hypothetical protein